MHTAVYMFFTICVSTVSSLCCFHVHLFFCRVVSSWSRDGVALFRRPVFCTVLVWRYVVFSACLFDSCCLVISPSVSFARILAAKMETERHVCIELSAGFSGTFLSLQTSPPKKSEKLVINSLSRSRSPLLLNDFTGPTRPEKKRNLKTQFPDSTGISVRNAIYFGNTIFPLPFDHETEQTDFILPFIAYPQERPSSTPQHKFMIQPIFPVP